MPKKTKQKKQKKTVCPVVRLKSEIRSDATRKKLLRITSVKALNYPSDGQ